MLTESLGAILIAVISAAGSALVAWLKLRGDKTASVPVAYQALADVKEWTGQQLAERDRKIEHLESDVEELKTAVATWRGKFQSAVHYIRALYETVDDRIPCRPRPLKFAKIFASSVAPLGTSPGGAPFVFLSETCTSLPIWLSRPVEGTPTYPLSLHRRPPQDPHRA